jgi:lipopolysaccharide export system protein LptC
MVFGFNITIAPTYILSQIELEAKGYGLKHSIANLVDQPSYTLYATTVLKYNSQGRAQLLLVSKQNLKPSSWRI